MFKSKICTKCGLRNHHKTRHCGGCGEVLPWVAKVSRKSLFFVLIVAFLLLGSGVAYGANLYVKKSARENTIQNSQEKAEVKPNKASVPAQEQVQTSGITLTSEDTSNKANNTAVSTNPNSTPKPQIAAPPSANIPTTQVTGSTIQQAQSAVTQPTTVPTPVPASMPTPPPTTPSVNNKWCEESKSTLISLLDDVYEGKVNKEEQQHKSNTGAIKQSYVNRGLLNSGGCQEELDNEDLAHQQRLSVIDYWYAGELVKINQSCS